MQGRKVIQLHGALEIVWPVVGQGQRAPDRSTGVVDQDVHPAVLGKHVFHHPIDGIHIGQVAREHVGGTADTTNLRGGLLQLVLGAGDEQYRSAGLADL
ncbi:Uncharacterised protein [Mycobacteroides abscessus subsp. massiliense]|nr:Uncharacterised protein [Mycobacteroides abscessus subsp. massiliense]